MSQQIDRPARGDRRHQRSSTWQGTISGDSSTSSHGHEPHHPQHQQQQQPSSPSGTLFSPSTSSTQASSTTSDSSRSKKSSRLNNGREGLSPSQRREAASGSETSSVDQINLGDAPLFLSIDSSQKRLRAVIVNEKCQVIYTESVECDREMPEYKTLQGVYRYNSKVTEPSEMRIKALDLILEKIARDCPDPDLLNKVRCIGGSGQQFTLHYLSNKFPTLLEQVASRPQNRLSTLLSANAGAFSLPVVGTGQDRSTGEECRVLELLFSDHPELASSPPATKGKARWTEEQARKQGRAAVADRTGSRCWPGWSAAQLLDVRMNDESGYTNERVTKSDGAQSLVDDHLERTRQTVGKGSGVWDRSSRLALESTLLSSLFLGRLAPPDPADACAMNMFNQIKRDWDDEMLEAVSGDYKKKFEDGEETGAQKLRRLLGPIMKDGATELGKISPYFVERYHFSSDCIVSPFTGDAPASSLAYNLGPRDVLVCLGVRDSDSLIIPSRNYLPGIDHEMMIHPARKTHEADQGMPTHFAEITGRDGGVGRSLARDMYANGDWNVFARLVALTPHGGELGLDDKKFLFWITESDYNRPQGLVRCSHGARVKEFDDRKISPRLLLESQFFSLRARLGKFYHQSRNKAPLPSYDLLGFEPDDPDSRPERIIAVGGACVNPAMISLLSTCFGSPVYMVTQLLKETNGPDSRATSSGLGGAHKAAWIWARHIVQDPDTKVGSYREFLERIINENHELEQQQRTGEDDEADSDCTTRPDSTPRDSASRVALEYQRSNLDDPGAERHQDGHGLKLLAEPDLDEHRYYSSMLREYARLEHSAASAFL